MFSKLVNNRLFLPLLLVLLIIPTFSFLLRPGLYWNMHDDMQLIRQMEMEKCLSDGQIPCRWTPDLGYNYGYPLFNFYPPLPYLSGQLFRFLGFDYISTVKFNAILLILSSTFAMYLLAGSLTGPTGAFLASLFYAYAPYHAVNIYVRGAMNEAWATLFFPLILYFSKKLLTTKLSTTKLFTINLILLSLSWAGLLLSHNPMAMTFSFFFALWCLYWYWQSGNFLKIKPILSLLTAGLLALSLAAFFTIPVLFESKLVQIESMFQNYYHYSVHFISLRQIFLNLFWGDGPSLWGTFDGMSFMLGTFHWLIPSILFAYFVFQALRHRRLKEFLLPIMLISMAFMATFMTHEKSTILWKYLAIVQKIQFPWRFLNHSLFFFSLSLAFLPQIFKKMFPKISLLPVIILALALVSLNYKYFFPVTFGPITDSQKFSGLAWTNQITSGIYDYLPKTASTAAKVSAKELIDEVEPASTEYHILSQQKGSDWRLFNLKNETAAKFTLAQLYFPNYQVFDNAQPQKFEIEPLLGRITLNLEPGYHQIFLKFTNTPIRTFSNYLSLSAWIFVILFIVSALWNIRKSKK